MQYEQASGISVLISSRGIDSVSPSFVWISMASAGGGGISVFSIVFISTRDDMNGSKTLKSRAQVQKMPTTRSMGSVKSFSSSGFVLIRAAESVWHGVDATPIRLNPFRIALCTAEIVGAAVYMDKAHESTSSGYVTMRGSGSRPSRPVRTAPSI